MDINELLRGISCSCGKHHTCAIKQVWIGDGAIAHLTDLTSEYRKILIVADENTYRAAGEETERYLSDKDVTRLIFPGDTVLVPNEAAIAATEATLGSSELIIGIGSGVIQDLCKYVSHFSHVPYFVIATAPSMDGYASSGAAMITDGMKVTYSAGVPEAILADTNVLKDAPLEMIKAGYGDIIGKYSALNDWRLGHIVNGEYFCDYIYTLTYDMVKNVLPLAKKLLARDKESVKTLMEALIFVGIAMSFAGNSRPASGSEHHLSHFFEITGIIDKEDYFPHGIDVVYSTAITCKIREIIAASTFPKEQFTMDEQTYAKEMTRVYKSVADGCMQLQKKLGTYSACRTDIYLAKEEEIKAVLRDAPTSHEILDILGDIGLDINEFYSMYSESKLSDAIRYAKDLKDRYTVLWMYYDMFGTKEI